MIPGTQICDCCGLPVQVGGDGREGQCPRCGYPVGIAYEKPFLQRSIADLQRVAHYGGGLMTVDGLIQRYRLRLEQLQRWELMNGWAGTGAPVGDFTSTQSTEGMPVAVGQQNTSAPVVPVAREMGPQSMPDQLETGEAGQRSDDALVPKEAAGVGSGGAGGNGGRSSVFSLKSFFADQTINIVAALGAFLLLAGSLGFIVTTSSLLLAFVVTFVVHAIFGVTGVVSYRFRTFRIVAIIYTAIFALLVPLVGFAGYRLITQNFVTLSAPTVIAIMALYAALVYAALAVLQKFSLFSYLSIVALVVADLSLCNALKLTYWWWPSVFMVLPFLSLAGFVRNQRFADRIAILREPLQLLGRISVPIYSVGIVVVLVNSLVFDLLRQTNGEVRWALVSLLVLVLLWVCLYVCLNVGSGVSGWIPYLLVWCLLAGCYAWRWHAVAYVLVLIVVAWLYYGAMRLPALTRFFLRLRMLRLQMQSVILLAMAVLPMIVAPLLSLQLLARSGIAVQPTVPTHIVPGYELGVEMVALLAGCVLTLLMLVQRIGWNRQPVQWGWYYLPLLTGYLFSCVFGLLVLMVGGEPVWWYVGFALVTCVAAVIVRKKFGDLWANALDVIALFGIGQTFILSLPQGEHVRLLVLLVAFAVLIYAVLLYQRRWIWLFVPVIPALLAMPLLANYVPQSLIACVILPLSAVGVRWLMRNVKVDTHMVGMASIGGNGTASGASGVAKPNQLALTMLPWEWPPLLMGLLYSLVIIIHDFTTGVASLQQWWPLLSAPALELGVLALVWYAVAVGMGSKWWTGVALVFGLLALFSPGNSFWAVAIIAFLLVVAASGTTFFAGESWSYPVYGSALLAALAAGILGEQQGKVLEATWVLLAFAAFLYLDGVVRGRRMLAWIAPLFAAWSVYNAGQAGDLYRAPLVALVCMLVGGGMLLLARQMSAPRVVARAPYRWPLYAVAAVSIFLTGLRGSLGGIEVPFYGAIPLALVGFALLVWALMLIEQRPEVLVLVGGLGIWAITLMGWAYWQCALATMGLIVFIFITQLTWRFIVDGARIAEFRRWHVVLGLSGQGLLALSILIDYALFDNAAIVAHIGATSFLLLAILLMGWGWIEQDETLRHRCNYAAGLLVALIVPWELFALHHTRIDWLTLAPATYLTVIAPFVGRDEAVGPRHRLEQLCAIVGAILLLGPTFWLSFSQNDLPSTLILAGESLALFLLGVATRIRIFVLCGAGLVVVCAMHALFLPSVGLSPSLALATMGLTLLALAAGLSLARHRLQHVWSQLE